MLYVSPSQRAAHLEAKERQARMAAKAYKPSAPQELQASKPKRVTESWVQRQLRLHPMPQVVLPKNDDIPPQVARIQEIVAEHFGLTRADLLSSRRVHRFVRPRHIAIYICRKLRPGDSFPTIGRRFGDRDHTTIIHAIRLIASLMEADDELKRTVEMLTEQVRA